MTFSLLLLAAGVILLLSNFNVIRVQRVWDLWPLVLIAAGALFLLDHLGLFYLSSRIAWPLILVAFGDSESGSPQSPLWN